MVLSWFGYNGLNNPVITDSTVLGQYITNTLSSKRTHAYCSNSFNGVRMASVYGLLECSFYDQAKTRIYTAISRVIKSQVITTYKLSRRATGDFSVNEYSHSSYIAIS